MGFLSLVAKWNAMGVWWITCRSLNLSCCGMQRNMLQLNLRGSRIHQHWQFHHLKRPKGNMNSHIHISLGAKAVFASKRVQTDNLEMTVHELQKHQQFPWTWHSQGLFLKEQALRMFQRYLSWWWSPALQVMWDVCHWDRKDNLSSWHMKFCHLQLA